MRIPVANMPCLIPPRLILIFRMILPLSALALMPLPTYTQQPSELVTSGQVTINGQQSPYRIRHLPVSSFPELPAHIAAALVARNCLIPQTYEAHRPENVIHASLEAPGTMDWAVLCSANGQVDMLVFFASASASEPITLATTAETDRLQTHDSTGVLGFNWGIDPAGPRRVHEAIANMARRPALPDHDSLADSTLDHRTVYHHYRNRNWETIVVE